MISPIKKQKNPKKEKDKSISSSRFQYLIEEIYSVMLDYSRIRKVFLTKDQPIQIGNSSFWFESNEETGEAYIKFNTPVSGWNEDSILRDLNTHFHNLFYSN